MKHPQPEDLKLGDEFIGDAELFRIVAETASDAIVTIDDENKILFVNSSAERIFGYSVAEMLGQNISVLMPDRFWHQHAAGLRQITETRQKCISWKGKEIAGLHKSGTEMPLEISFGMTEKNGRFVFTGIIRDITERKLAAEALQKSEERLRMLFDRMTDGFYLSTAEGKFVDLNPAMVKMFGYESREEMMQVDIPRDLYFSPDERTSRALDDGKEVSEVYRMRRKDGSVIWVEDKGNYILDQDGNIRLHHGLLRDVTQRVRIEEALRENERVVSTLMSNLPGMAYRCQNDESRTMQFVSDGCFDLTGYSPDELIDNKKICYTELIHEDDLPLADIVASALAENTPFQLTYRLKTKTGNEKWVWEQGRGVYSSNGEVSVIEGLVIDITERIKAEQSLRRAEANYRNLVELLPAIVYLAEPSPPYTTVYISPDVESLGYPLEDWYAEPEMWIKLIHKDDRERVLKITEEARNQGLDTELEYRIKARDGSTRWFLDKGHFILDEKGNKNAWQGILLDITETKRLEEQLQQSQKLESVGRLAGGIAHDFNNMLTAINGYSDLSLRQLESGDPLRRNLGEIKKAGQRSSSLINQLLAFSRQQLLQPQIIDLDKIIPETASMIERLIGEDIQLTTKLNHKGTSISVDPSQFVQVIMNLAVNARDAMPNGGRLTIETARIEADYDFSIDFIPSRPGIFVMIAVSDTGSGIGETERERIFEPFYTTKDVGKGTGLGLSTVYGIIKQSGGYIVVESKLGEGTTFRIYLPATEEIMLDINNDLFEETNGTETILLVEDEELVRAVTKEMLECCGYRVMEARNGKEALELCSQTEILIDLVVTDVVMPEMGGRELAENLAEIRPRLSILFTSGYTDDFVTRDRFLESSVNFIQKPFSLEQLTNKIKTVLKPHDDEKNF